MTHLNLKYLCEDVDRHGNVRIYFRRKGQPKIRLRGIPGSEEFMRDYGSALANVPKETQRTIGRPRKGSFEFVCLHYYASPTFKALSPHTQSWRRRALDVICEEHGSKDISAMAPRNVRKLRDQLRSKPGASRSRIKALKALFAWATEQDIISENPTIGVNPLKYVSKSHHTWTMDEVWQYEKRHPIGTKARLALALLLYTSWRREDIPKLGKQHVYDGSLPDGTRSKWFKYRLAKNKNRSPSDMDIPMHRELEAIIAATSHNLIFLTTSYGKPYTTAGFGNRFKKWCQEAGLPHCTCHGLRSATASRLAEKGATDFEIMSITGHKSLAEVQLYTKRANQKVLSASGMNKLK